MRAQARQASVPGAAAAPWAAVAHAVLAGVIAALHVGKAAIALPQLSAEFQRPPTALGWMMSAFPLVGMFGGIAAGVLAQGLGDRRLLILGMLVLAAASTAGAWAPDYVWLLATRLFEGLGFLLVVVAAPAVLHRLATPQSRAVVSGIWSTFMGAGMALSLAFGPMLGDWRRLWTFDAALALLAAVTLPLTVPAAAGAGLRSAAAVWRDVRDVLTARRPLLLALIFGAYTLQFLAVMSFLPVFLIQRMGASAGQAGLLSAVAVAANILGNLAAGPLLARSRRPGRLLAGVSIAMGLGGGAVFLPGLPPGVAFACCFAFSAIGGMLPTMVIALTPPAAPAPALAPLGLGLVMQGNYLGQVLGPVLAGAAVSLAGWPAAAAPIAAAAILGAGLALALDGRARHRR